MTAVDQSGRFSRGGYRFQDLCALRYCVAASHDGLWDEVHCEAEDDVVLVRSGNPEVRRFVQVKHEGSASGHWSVPRITAPEPGKTVQSSILAKLFSRGLVHSNPEFRLAVNEGVDDELRRMSYAWGGSEPDVDLSCDAAMAIVSRLGSWDPGTGAKVEDFVGSFLMELHSNTIVDMQARLHREIVALLLSMDEGALVDDDVTRVFRQLFWIVFDAASATDPAQAVVEIEAFRRAAADEARRSRLATTAAAGDPGGALDRFLAEAGVEPEAATTARDLRREYLVHWRRSLGTPRARLLETWHAAIGQIIDDELSVRGRSAAESLAGIMSRLSEVSDQDADADTLSGIVYFAISRGAAA